MKPTSQLFLGLILALICIGIGHKLVTGQIVPSPTSQGLFSMEVVVFVLLTTSYIVAEIRTMLASDKPELRFRNVFFLLVALLGSGAVFAALKAMVTSPK